MTTLPTPDAGEAAREDAAVQQDAMSERRPFSSPRISPNGDRVAVGVNDTSGPDIWILDLGPGTFRRFTTSTTAQYPLWTPDGARVAFSGGAGAAIIALAADGSGASETLLTERRATFLAAESWTPDGNRLIVRELTGSQNLMVLDTGSTEPVSLFESPVFNEDAASLSHDGRWLAYVSDRSGSREVYVRPFPGPGGEQLISTAGGSEPAWAPDDSEIYYKSTNRLLAVAVETTPEFRISAREELFDVSGYMTPSSTRTQYDVHPDGDRFLMIRRDENTASRPKINVVLNWFEEVKERLPTGR